MRIDATLLTFDEHSTPDVYGDVVTFAPGSLYIDGNAGVPLMVEHEHRATAAGVAVAMWTEGDTVRATFDLLDNPAGAALASELAAGVRMDCSIGVHIDALDVTERDADPGPFGPPLLLTVTLADLVEVSACLRGRMPSAHIDPPALEPPDQGEAQ